MAGSNRPWQKPAAITFQKQNNMLQDSIWRTHRRGGVPLARRSSSAVIFEIQRDARKDFFIWIRCNPLKRLDSGKEKQGNSSFFAWIYLDLLAFIERILPPVDLSLNSGLSRRN
jgi:hypothetical protein